MQIRREREGVEGGDKREVNWKEEIRGKEDGDSEKKKRDVGL